MIVVMLESDALQKTFETIIDSLRKVGETVELWWADRTIPLPTSTTRGEDVLAHEISGYQRYGNIGGRHMGYTRDLHLEAVAQFRDFTARIDHAKKQADPITHLLVCNSAFPATRAALVAAERLGVPATCAEEGLFRFPDGARTVVMSPGRSHFETLPGCLVADWKHHETCDKRFDTFRTAWAESRQVKYFVHDNRKDGLEMPSEWSDAAHTPHIVLFGGTPYDAGRYWGHKGPIVERMMQRQCAKHGAFYKAHPRVGDANTPPGLITLPSAANAHDILPKTDLAVTVRSNIGLEAMMYGIPLVTYGRPCWAELAYPNIQEALDHNSTEESAERKRRCRQFLDFLIHEYLVKTTDGPRLQAFLRWEQ